MAGLNLRVKRTTGRRRGTRANQIALICCASDKNVNARRPLVIQPQLRGLLFPPSFRSFSPTRPSCHPPPRLYSLSRATRLPLSAVLCSALRFSHVHSTAREEDAGDRVLSFTKGQSSDRFIRSSYAASCTSGFATHRATYARIKSQRNSEAYSKRNRAKRWKKYATSPGKISFTYRGTYAYKKKIICSAIKF